MSIIDRWTGRDLQTAIDASEAFSDVLTFAVDAEAIDPAVFGLTSYASTPGRAPRIDRLTAMQVPAVKRVRDLVCTAAGGLPLTLAGPTGQPIPWTLFRQPEKSIPRIVTMTRLYEDLLFEGIAWWQVVELNEWDFPQHVDRVAPSRVRVEDGRLWLDGRELTGQAKADMIRFDSPNDPLLVAGARAIRTCLLLDAAAARHADGTPPLDYFTPGEGMDPMTSNEEVLTMLNEWHARRQVGYTGYVPAALKYNVAGWSPEQLQLADARQHAVLEIARTAGVDPEELGVSTTSRTYSNEWTRRKAFLDFTLGGYTGTVENRLAMPDVTPEGSVSRVDLDGFLRTDTKERYETYKLGLEVGAIEPAEVRAAEGKPPLAAPATPTTTPREVTA